MVRISQIYLEPILFAAMASLPNVTIINSAFVESYVQHDGNVTVHCRYNDSDGGRSIVCKQMGAQLTGDAEIGRTRSTLVRSPQIRALFGDRRPAWMSWIVNGKLKGIPVGRSRALVPGSGPERTRSQHRH